MHKLEAKELVKRIGKKEIVKGVSLDVVSGEVVGLLGPNGAGKTTTFYMICGIIEPTSGEVFLDEKDITPLSLSQRARLGIGYLPQESSIFSELSVEDNLYIAAEAGFLKKDEIEERVSELLKTFNIEHIRKRAGIKLSGGERRRVEIARALVNRPKFLLLDEPFAGVDPIAVSDIQKVIKQLAKMDIGILITDHNVRETLNICNRAYVLESGKILASGKASEIAQNELVRKFYLGEDFRF
ncbi:MAG: LPS export ABC transporter ATP-binding protein [Epsilonproteobacteria bacterium]|nr:LPS export ABC transporter ATP-binding protein [Campylobacterota bacterium]